MLLSSCFPKHEKVFILLLWIQCWASKGEFTFLGSEFYYLFWKENRGYYWIHWAWQGSEIFLMFNSGGFLV